MGRLLMTLLPAIALLAAPGFARQREATEWTRMTWYQANEDRLPRVLLIGDSICNGYESLVREKLAGQAHVAFCATSKCVTDPTFLDLLSFVLGEADHDVIHFNNGLHSLGTDRAAWQAGLRAAFDLLEREGNGATIVWATSTPLKDPALTAKASELNAIAARVVAERGYPVNDLFALMDPQDRDKLWSDTFHYHAAGREMQAAQVADTVRPLLPEPAPADAADALVDGDFEAEGSDAWRLYPFKPEAGSIERVADDAREGKVAKVNAAQAGVQFYQHHPKLTPGQRYTLRLRARADQPGTLQVHLRTQKPPYEFFGDKTVELTDQWQEISTDIELPADYDPALWVLFLNLKEPGTYWFDDVRFEAQ